jgi:hypothetical protein
MKTNKQRAILAAAAGLALITIPFGLGKGKADAAAFIGIWDRDLAKSGYGAIPPPKTARMVIFSYAKSSIKWMWEATYLDGRSANNSYDGAADGKFYPLLSDSQHQTLAYTKQDGSAMAVKDSAGHVVLTSTISPSADGKTMTQRATLHRPDTDISLSKSFRELSKARDRRSRE